MLSCKPRSARHNMLLKRDHTVVLVRKEGRHSESIRGYICIVCMDVYEVKRATTLSRKIK